MQWISLILLIILTYLVHANSSSHLTQYISWVDGFFALLEFNTQNKNLVEVGHMSIKNGPWLVNLLVIYGIKNGSQWVTNLGHTQSLDSLFLVRWVTLTMKDDIAVHRRLRTTLYQEWVVVSQSLSHCRVLRMSCAESHILVTHSHLTNFGWFTDCPVVRD